MVGFQRFTAFANGILNNVNGPQLYCLEVNKMVATIRSKTNQRPLVVELIKNIDEHRQLLAIQSKFEEKGFDVEVTPVESKLVSSELFQNFNENANGVLSDPNGKELYHFQIYGFAAVIRAKADGRVACIHVAASSKEYNRLLQVKDKFANEGFDVEVVDFKFDEHEAETPENPAISETAQQGNQVVRKKLKRRSKMKVEKK